MSFLLSSVIDFVIVAQQKWAALEFVAYISASLLAIALQCLVSSMLLPFFKVSSDKPQYSLIRSTGDRKFLLLLTD